MNEVSHLRTILEAAKELSKSPEPCLEGDVERVIAIVVNKLRLLDPENMIEFMVDFE